MANVVRRVVIEGLYDNYNYDITFHKDGVTLITGPNGYGKTTVLNIIKNALEQNFFYFYELLFKGVVLYFDDNEKGPRLLINKVKAKQETLFDEDSNFDLVIEFYNGNVKKATDSFTINQKFMRHRGEFIRSVYRENEMIFLDDDFDYHHRYLVRSNQEVRQHFRNFQIFLNDRNCLFIKEQRMFSSNKTDDDEEKYTIMQLAEDLKKRYAMQKSRYTDEGQKIDSSFVERLLGREYKEYEQEEYLEKIRGLERIVGDYKRFDLISNYSFVGKFDKEFKPALSLYIDDMFKKIGVYEAFFRQLSLFNSFVNGKGLSNKRMILDEKNGISFRSDSGRVVPLHKLSSGEQNLVILYYRLVFETKPNTLLLIDEPENSMHVEWLEKMLRDYFVMEGDLQCQMVIATHSPIFIGDNFNIAYDLYGGSYQDWMK